MTAPWPRITSPTPTQCHARAKFHEAVEETGEAPPCTGRPEWTSTHRRDRQQVLEVCLSRCQVLDACDELRRAFRAKSGVWAGIDVNKYEKES